MPEDLRSFHYAAAYENARPEVAALVPSDARRILDLGCSSGALGAALRVRQGAEVIGVERDPDLARQAASRLDRVIEGDLEVLAGEPPPLGPIDCLIAADVLEHLQDPWRVLEAFATQLRPGGTAVVSLPNVRYWQTFVDLGLRGFWPRNDFGIFDRTHLRWFTLGDARALLTGAGLVVAHESPQYRLRPVRHETGRAERVIARTRLRPFFAFQYVLAAVKPGPRAGSAPAATLPAAVR